MTLYYNLRHFRAFFYLRWLIVHYNIKGFLKWVWNEAKDWKNLLFIILWWLILGSPTWVGYGLYFVTKNAWHLTYANAVFVFWTFVPGTPLVPLSIALGLATRKIVKKIFKG